MRGRKELNSQGDGVRQRGQGRAATEIRASNNNDKGEQQQKPKLERQSGIGGKDTSGPGLDNPRVARGDRT